MQMTVVTVVTSSSLIVVGRSDSICTGAGDATITSGGFTNGVQTCPGYFQISTYFKIFISFLNHLTQTSHN